MIAAQFPKYDIEGGGFGALLAEFRDQAAVHLARPKQTEMQTDRAIPNSFDALLGDEDEAEIRGDRGRIPESSARPHVEGHPFDAVEGIQIQKTQENEQNQRAKHDQGRDAFGGLDLHATQRNKKTRATQGCSGFGKFLSDLAAALVVVVPLVVIVTVVVVVMPMDRRDVIDRMIEGGIHIGHASCKRAE